MKRKKNNNLHIGIDGTPFFRRIDGIGRYSHNILKPLAAQHPHATFTIIGFKGDTPNKELVADLPSNVDFFYIPLPRRLYQGLFSRAVAINLQLLAPKFDHIIHLNFTLFPYIKRSATTHTVFVHDTTFIDMPEVVASKNLRYLRRRVPWSLKRTTNIATISDFTSQRIKDIYHQPTSKIHMVGAGVDTVYFQQSPKPDRLPDKYLLAIGTLEPRKNLESLIKAHLGLPKVLQAQYPLVIGGSHGWKNERLLSLIKSSRYIKHIGYVDDADLPGLYQHASLFAFPSLYEGFGMPLLEAMASKVPVITNDTALFNSIGKNYIDYIDTTNIAAFTQYLAARLNKPPSKQQLSHATQHARTFKWEASSKRLWEVIKEERLTA